MTDKPKGIVDPWRKVEPLRKPERKPPTPAQQDRIDISDIDRDADLAIPGRHTIRFEHASFQVTSVRVETPKDALDVLANAVVDAWMIRPVGAAFTAAGIGVRYRERAFNVPSEESPASTIKGGNATLWFIGKPLDTGMLVLARVLRMPEAAAICKKHGVTVMM